MAKVLIPQDVAIEGKEFLLSKGYEIKMGSGLDAETMAKDAADCDAILMRTAKCPKEVMEAAPNVKIVARHGVGYDNIDYEAAEKLGIYVTNTPQALSDSVAEFTMAAVLLLAKNIEACSRAERDGDYFYKNTHKGIDLMGKKLAIIGFGRIGRAVAQKAKFGFDMEILAYDPFAKPESVPDYVKLVSWEEAWSTADIVSLHLPSTKETKGSVNASVFEMMKDGAMLINAARGDIVNEADLVAALKAGKPVRAVIYVCSVEPTPVDNPLFALDNCIMTPHMASNTEECMARMALHAAWEIDRVLSGQKPNWQVNHPSNPRSEA